MLERSIVSMFEANMLQVAIELGAYIGYSAVRIASQLPPGGKLYSIDPNESHVRVARSLIQHAGLSDKVEVIQGILETSIQVHAFFLVARQECFMGTLWLISHCWLHASKCAREMTRCSEDVFTHACPAKSC